MMQRMLGLLGCVMLVAAAAPTAVAHWGSGENQPDTTGGVAGRVVGFAGPSVTDRAGTSAVGIVVCDMEVGDPNGQNSLLNEEEVDGSSTQNGQVPDNTWDDGGYGGACHTQSYYANSDWNTAGCGSSPHAEARATVGPSGLEPLVGAACDYGTQTSSNPVDKALSASTCAANKLLGGQENELTQCTQQLTEPAGLLTCEPDGGKIQYTAHAPKLQHTGTVDNVTYGYANPFNGPSVPGTGPCSSGVTVLFVFLNVDTTTTVPVSGETTHVWTV